MPPKLQKGLAYLFSASAIILGILGGVVYQGENLIVIALALLSLILSIALGYRFYPSSDDLQ